MHDLSVAIIACNEERIIAKTLAAVAPLAGEIILVDSGSTDRTVEIARQYGAQCHYREWHGYAAQKNYAISLATKKWILSLDADEIVTDPLAKEIVNKITKTNDHTPDDIVGAGASPPNHMENPTMLEGIVGAGLAPPAGSENQIRSLAS